MNQILFSLNQDDSLNDNARAKPKHPAAQLENLLQRRAYDNFHITVNMLNENFGLCLPVRDFLEKETPASLDRRLSQKSPIKQT